MAKLKIYSIKIETTSFRHVKVCAETEEQAKEQTRTMSKDTMVDGDSRQVSITVSDVKDAVEVMDCTNGHSKNLVNKINCMYNVRKEDFLKIAQLIAQRDCDECWKHNIDPNNIKSFEGCIHEYLMSVADDKDLETILGYLRY